MAKYENPAELDYRNGGDTVDDFAQKYMRTVDYIIKALNDLRTPTGNTAGVEPEPYMWRIADNKLYIRNADNTDYVLLGDISPNFGFRQSVNDRFLTTADLEGEGAVVTRNEAGKVEGDITGSPGKIANKTIDVTPTADNDVIAYDAAQQKWVKKTLNDYLKKQGDAGWDEMVDEVADQVIEDITPIIFNFWYLDDDGYLVPLVGSTEGGLPSIHGMVGDYEQITARSVDVAGNLSATGNVTAGMLTTPQANVTTHTANVVNAGTVTANDIIAKGPVVDVRAFGAKGDGVTDDTAAIQAAIDSVTQNKLLTVVGSEKIATYQAPVIIPKGVYVISSPLVLSADTSLIGVGTNSTTLKATSGMDGLVIFGGRLENGNKVSKNLEIANINLACDGKAKVGLSNKNNVWVESANIHDVSISRATELGLDVASTWLSSFSNITIKGCPVGAYFGGNDSDAGCNDNTIINISVNNSSLINIIIESQCCNFIGVNVDRQKDYLQTGAITANSVVIHGKTYTDNTAILATSYCDCNKIDGLWFEWISNTSNTPVLFVKSINTYSNGHFKSVALQIANIHAGGYYQDIFKVLSGHVVVDNCRLDILNDYANYVIDTQGADANTSLLLKGMMMSAFTAWLNSGKTRITLPYGAFRAEGTLSNGTYKTYQPKSQNGYIAEDTSINMLESIDSNGFITKMINSGVYEKVSKSGYKMEINQFFIGFYNKLPEGATASTTVTTSIPVESGVIWTGMVVPRNHAGMTAIKNGYYLDIDTSGTYLTVTLRFSTALPSGNPNIHVILCPFSAT